MSAVSNLIPKDLKAVTPSDSASIAGCVGLLCISAGTAAVVTSKGTVTSVPMTVGQEIVVQITRVNATGTTGSYLGYFEI